MPETQDSNKPWLMQVSLQKDPATRSSICVRKNFLEGWLSRVKWRDRHCSIHEARTLPRFVKWSISPHKREEKSIGMLQRKIYWCRRQQISAGPDICISYMAIPCRGLSFLWAQQQQKFPAFVASHSFSRFGLICSVDRCNANLLPSPSIFIKR